MTQGRQLAARRQQAEDDRLRQVVAALRHRQIGQLRLTLLRRHQPLHGVDRVRASVLKHRLRPQAQVSQ